METLGQFILICLIVQYVIISDCGMTFRRKKRQSLPKTRSKCCSPQQDRKKSSNSLVKDAIKLINKIDSKNSVLLHDVQVALFEHSTNLTTFNQQKKANASRVLNEFLTNATEKASKFDWMKLKGRNDLVYRWSTLFLQIPMVVQSLGKSMTDIFNEARVCPKKDAEKSKCNLTIFPDIQGIIGESRDPDEMQYLWKQVRDETGKKIKPKFIEHVKLGNEGARKNNFSDYGEWTRKGYESNTFVSDMAEVVSQVQPLYRKFHAYVRKKLIKFYKNVYIAKDGPIPAHLFGDLYAQKWINILDITKPSNTETINVTDILVKRNATTIDMFMMAEDFFVSLDLERMTPFFWSKSVLEKPTDRNMTCNAAAFDMSDMKDYRIRMCNKITEDSLNTVFHEMGHIEQYMLYRKLPKVFRAAANPGFHEAIGEVVTLSASTLDYLQKAGYINKSVQYDEDLEIAYLFKTALSYLPSIPYAYIIDHYRYGIYNGSIALSDLNRMWWKYRLEYQGVCPPIKRTEKDFDAGAKYHVANIVEYMRYFVANIVAFQMHKALCKAAGHTGDLFKCSIYGNKAAGKLFKKVLSLGSTKPWQEVMMVLTGDTRAIDPKPFLEYFKKLEIWLETGENKNNEVGWKSQNSMVCPGKNDETIASNEGEKSTTLNDNELTSTEEEEETNNNEEETANKDKEETTNNDTQERINKDEEETTNSGEVETTNSGEEETTNFDEQETSNSDEEITPMKEKDEIADKEEKTNPTKEKETTIFNEEEIASTNDFKATSINDDKITSSNDGNEKSTNDDNETSTNDKRTTSINDKETATNSKETTYNTDKETTAFNTKQTTDIKSEELFSMLNDYIDNN